ncbi:MAG: PorT family protein [Bacteroides sp.]|nr:PorT family protein [Bacteroides sp.]MCM1095011.1 PorT family protein [Terasakiella sp.]
MKRIAVILAALLVLVAGPTDACGARRLNDKLENRPYADLRRWHLGFSLGAHTEDLRFCHNGFVTDAGEVWRAEQVSYAPGFTVSGLVALRLNNYFSLRFSPGMMFGSRNIRFRELGSGDEQKQNIKSTYITLPIDLKFAAMRVRNARPYVVGGVMPAFDVSKKRSDNIQLTGSDVYITVGFGCDFYLPFFKLIPELKFCFGLSDILRHDRPDLQDDPDRMKFTNSLTKATSKMIVLSFYFE